MLAVTPVPRGGTGKCRRDGGATLSVQLLDATPTTLSNHTGQARTYPQGDWRTFPPQAHSHPPAGFPPLLVAYPARAIRLQGFSTAALTRPLQFLDHGYNGLPRAQAGIVLASLEGWKCEMDLGNHLPFLAFNAPATRKGRGRWPA